MILSQLNNVKVVCQGDDDLIVLLSILIQVSVIPLEQCILHRSRQSLSVIRLLISFVLQSP